MRNEKLPEMATFQERFRTSPPGFPQGLQLVYPDSLPLEPSAVADLIQSYHPDLSTATIELVSSTRDPEFATLVSADGPPAETLGLIEWPQHRIKLAGFAGPMPYGPIETCVLPAMIDPALKQEARRHQSHVLLDYAGTHPDPVERYVALASVAGALAPFGASVVLNEDARTAAPAYDLVPDPEEDALATLRGLPIPYLWGGFVKLDVGQPDRPWVRTFANHRLGLPNLAYRLAGHRETSVVFQFFAGILGYLRQTDSKFAVGDELDLGHGIFRVRAPTESEWFLESEGTMLVLEPGQPAPT